MHPLQPDSGRTPRARVVLVAAILAGALVILAGSAQAVVTVGGSVTRDTTWTADDTIRAVSNVSVAFDAHLTIEAGTIVLFREGTYMTLYGQLQALGTEDNRVVFTSESDTVGGSPSAGAWSGIRFLSSSSGLVQGCHIRYADEALRVYDAAPEFRDCLIENYQLNGVYITDSDTTEVNTVRLVGCTVRQTDSDLLGTGTGITVRYTSLVDIANCDISSSSIGLYFYSYKAMAPHFDLRRCAIHDNADMGIQLFAGG